MASFFSTHIASRLLALVIAPTMNTNGFNNQFQSGMPLEEQCFQPSLSQSPFQSSSQMQYNSAYWQSTPQQSWTPQDGFTPYMLPHTQQRVPQWVQPTQAHMVAQQQQVLQPGGDFRQRPQQLFLPQHIVQGFHPQPMQEYCPQHLAQQHHAQPLVQEGLSQQSVQELVGAVAVQLGYTRNVEPTSARVIAQCARNDKIVIDALKRGKAKGLNALGAIEKLGNANGHSNTLWKNYALARLDKISPRVYSICTGARSSNRSGSRKTTFSGGPFPPHLSQQAASSWSCTGIDNHANPNANCLVNRRLEHENQAFRPSCTASERDGLPTNGQARTRRGGPIPEFHAGTLIPPLPPSSQPKPPVRDPDNDHEGHRFTDEDKIFFIHFLKSYLGQGGGARIPEREDLYLLLARQTPHHNAEAWRRHWDDAPELPDKIYIEARKRADDAALARSASLSPSSNEDGSEDCSDTEDDGPFEESASSVLNQIQRMSPTRRHPKKATRSKFRVTEEDLREMALYKYERRSVWDRLPNFRAQWKEFAERPQNTKRSVGAWYSVSRRYNAEMNRYYKEYADSACDGVSELGVESELEYVDVATSGQLDTGSTSASSSTSSSSGASTHGSDEASTLPRSSAVPQKRERPDSKAETACSLGDTEEDFPAAKRVKEEDEDEKPELWVLDSD